MRVASTIDRSGRVDPEGLVGVRAGQLALELKIA
jgi:hypothetical protein